MQIHFKNHFEELALIFAILLVLFGCFSLFVSFKESRKKPGKWYLNWSAFITYLSITMALTIFSFFQEISKLDYSLVLMITKAIFGLLAGGYGIFATFHKFEDPIIQADEKTIPVAWDKWVGISFALMIAFLGVGSEIIAYDVQNKGSQDFNAQLQNIGIGNEQTRSHIVNLIHQRMNIEKTIIQNELEKEKEMHRIDIEATKSELEKERQLHQSDLNLARDDIDKEKQIHIADVASVRSELEKVRDSYKNEISSLNAILEKDRQTHANELTAIRNDFDKDRQFYIKELDFAKSELEKNKQSNSIEIALTKTALEKERLFYTNNINEIKTGYEKERQSNLTQLSSLKSDLEKEKQYHLSDMEKSKAELLQSRKTCNEALKIELQQIHSEISALKGITQK